MNYKNTRQGFTLIELLVVVIIIGILAAVAVPQYQKVVERSKAAEAITLLSSIAKAYQVYYLANGTYATKFAELDVDIPFTGNKAVVIVNQRNLRGDTKSNDDWSFQIQDHSEPSGYITLFAFRLNGKYQGAGFKVSFLAPADDVSVREQIRCYERMQGASVVFNPNLAPGSYCERIMQAQKESKNTWGRSYVLP